MIRKFKAAIKQRQEKRDAARLDRLAAFVPIKLDYTQSDLEKKYETIYNERKGYFGIVDARIIYDAKTEPEYRHNLRMLALEKAVDTFELILTVSVAGIITIIVCVAGLYVLDILLFFVTYALWQLFSRVIPAEGLAFAFFLMNKFFSLFLGDWFIDLGFN